MNSGYLILEARESSLIAMGTLYSVALESLSTVILSDEKRSYHFITEKKDRKELKNKLLGAAKKFFDDKGLLFEVSPIKIRIDNITSPTNKDKLSLPFRMLSIPLLKNDLEIIGKRNDFLHGNSFLKSSGDFKEEANELWKVALRLSLLVNALVLKHIGHTGYIENNAGFLIKEYVDTPEKLYRKI